MRTQPVWSPADDSGLLYSHTDYKGIISKLGSISLARWFYGYYYNVGSSTAPSRNVKRETLKI